MTIRLSLAPAAVLGSLALASAAQAHITVWPNHSTLSAREKYVVRVPNERASATVRIDGEFPPGVAVSSLEEVPGWTAELHRDGSGRVVGATWTGRLAPERFVEFGLLAANPSTGDSAAWKFTQTYADGTRVEWTGPKGSKTPAPVVTFTRP